MTNTNKCYSLENAKYGIYQNGSLVQELITDKNGYAKSAILQEGSYQVKEIEASKGYTVDSQTYNVTVTKDTTVPALSNEAPKNDPVGIEIVKNDAEDLGLPQGDATLEGAEFTVTYYGGLYTKEEIEARKYETDKAEVRTWVLKTKKMSSGKYIAGLSNTYKVSGNDFFYDANGGTCLPLGTITIEETKAPEGYLLEGAKLNVTDTATGVTTTVTDTKYYAQITEDYQGAKLQFGNDANQMIVKDKVKKQKIQIFKSGYRNGMSEVVKGLQGAEFTFKLKSEVDHVGWDSATVYDTITTDEDGWAITKELPYGTYLVRETVTPKDFYTNPDFIVSVTQDTSEIKKEEDKIKKIILNNRPVETQLKLVKKDKTTGKTVTLNSASFKIVADEDIIDGGNVVYKKGQTITQKVGGKKYDTFTTNSDNVVVVNDYNSRNDSKGEVILPLQLFAGKYHLEEVKVPKGFLALGQSQTFELTGKLDYTKDEDGDPIYTLEIRNAQSVAEIKINKIVSDLDTEVDLVNRTNLNKIKFVLKAKEKIFSVIDGTLMFDKDQTITTTNSAMKIVEGSQNDDGTISLSKESKLEVTNLPIGVDGSDYYLEEVETLDGSALDTIKKEAEKKKKKEKKLKQQVN